MEAQDEEITVERAVENFAAEVARWREVRGMSKRGLAQAMGFDPSYVSHVESGRHRPREEFARLADEALNAGKAIWRRWCDYEQAKTREGPARRPPGATPAPRRAAIRDRLCPRRRA
ncbi:multiprotein-bridging factor 1 family protein [Streptomyces noursei]|uniref:helix-turn-helix domain-containing protein n=1 Tax=Streptomyces noursei TaxID=1971 RepID=UPI0035D604B0